MSILKSLKKGKVADSTTKGVWWHPIKGRYVRYNPTLIPRWEDLPPGHALRQFPRGAFGATQPWAEGEKPW